MNLNNVTQRVLVYRANPSLYITLILLMCRCIFRRLYIIYAAIKNALIHSCIGITVLDNFSTK